MRRAGKDFTYYNLIASNPLPNRDAILKNKHNKRELSRVLSLFNLSLDVIINSRYYGEFTHLHLHRMLCKAADQQASPKVDIAQFDCEVKAGMPSPCIDIGFPTPQGVIYIINCG